MINPKKTLRYAVDTLVFWWGSAVQRLFGLKCLCCRRRGWDVRLRRMDTVGSLENDSSNYTVECDRCFEYTQQFWAYMWAEYNATHR